MIEKTAISFFRIQRIAIVLDYCTKSYYTVTSTISYIIEPEKIKEI